MTLRCLARKPRIKRFKFLNFTNTTLLIVSGTKSSYRLKLRESSKPQQSTAKYDMNDCLLESENFQITKSDNNKYLLLPVKKQQAEKFVLKECGKDIDSDTNYPSFTHTHTHTHFIFFFFKIKFAKKTQKLFVTNFHIYHTQSPYKSFHYVSIGKKISFSCLSVETLNVGLWTMV